MTTMPTIEANLSEKEAESFRTEIEMLRSGIAAGLVRNAAFVRAKFSIGCAVDRVAKKLAYTDELVHNHNVSGYIMPHEAASKLKKLVKHEGDPLYAPYLALLREAVAINDLYKAAKPVIVKGRLPNTEPADPRTLENTGTCGICGHNHKLAKDGTLVLHGYKRPGNGYTYGNCFGYRYQPYEISHAANVAFAVHLDELIAIEQKKLFDLNAGKVISFTRQRYVGHGRDRTLKVETFTKAEKPHEYAQLLEQALYDVERDLRYLNDDKVRNATRIANWKPRPLPGTVATGEGK